MPLTYQPFAATPQVEELRQDLQMNVPNDERFVSAFAGAALLAGALAGRGVVRWALLAIGGALVYRGSTGHCPLYARLDLDRRHAARGVPGNRGIKVEGAVSVQCSPDVLYRYWRNFEQLPRIMRHVKAVTAISEKRSHWKVAGPLGRSVEWDAELINDQPGKLIAWESLPGAAVRNAGSVWFEAQRSGETRVKVSLEFDPPAGAVGAAIAEMLGSSPRSDLAEDLARFKDFAEKELAKRGRGHQASQSVGA